MQTATFDAAMGNTEGGVTNLSIKAGSNALKGTAYYGKTPRSLFANDFFANANNIPLADFTYNRYGGTAGGPVLFPGYDGRRRTFFMYGFEGIHEASAQQRHADGADREENGDFSSCWRSARSTRSTTRSRAGRWPRGGSRPIRSRATSFRRA